MPREGGGGVGGGTSAAAFRSYGFCKDPVGVVELQTIRKPRTSPTRHKTDQKLESSKNRARFFDGPCLELEEKVISNRDRHTVREDDANSSRRSWSCANNHNDLVAADFLKGALELEHSLALLRKLQEDSNYLSTRVEQRKTTISGGSRFADLELGKMNLFNFSTVVGHEDEVQLHYVGSQHQDPFVDTKRLMRDGASASLNDLFDSSPLTEDRRVVMDSSDVPSTSSSCHTSFVHSSGFVSPESSISSTASPNKKNKKKKSNLVAKLVSLEDTFWRRSSSPLNPSRRRLKEQRKPPVDSIRASAQYSDGQVMDEKWKKTLDEMIEAVKLKGLLKNSTSNKDDTGGNHSLNSGFFSSKKKWCGDDTPPIVVIKPTIYSCLNLDLPITPMPRDKATPSSEQIVRSSRESPVLDKSLKQTKMVEGGGVIKDRVWKGEVYYDTRAMNKVLTSPATKTKLQKEEKEFDPVCMSRGKEDILRNLYFNANPGNDRRSKLENQAHLSGSGYWRKNRSKYHKSSKQTRHIVDNCENKDKSRDPSSIDDNESILQLDNNTVLADQLDRDGNIIEDLAEKEYSIPRKIASQPNPGVNAKTNCSVGGGIKNRLQASIDDYEEFDCSISESSSLTSFEEDEFLEQEINKLISPISQIRLVSPHEGVETVHHTDDAQSHPDQSDPLLPNTSKEEEAADHENDRESRVVTTADCTYLDCTVCEEEEFEEIARWKVMLLRSSSFIHHANELFDLQADPERCIVHEESEHHHYQDELLLVSSSTLVLDCANELLDYYGYLSQERLMWILHRRHGMNRGSYCFTSLYQVVDQVCKGVDSLRFQRKDGGDCDAACNLPLIVERDLMGSNGVISGVWGVGWNNSMGTIDDVEDIARLVDGVILKGLIEEIVEESFSV